MNAFTRTALFAGIVIASSAAIAQTTTTDATKGSVGMSNPTAPQPGTGNLPVGRPQADMANMPAGTTTDKTDMKKEKRDQKAAAKGKTAATSGTSGTAGTTSNPHSMPPQNPNNPDAKPMPGAQADKLYNGK